MLGGCRGTIAPGRNLNPSGIVVCQPQFGFRQMQRKHRVAAPTGKRAAFGRNLRFPRGNTVGSESRCGPMRANGGVGVLDMLAWAPLRASQGLRYRLTAIANNCEMVSSLCRPPGAARVSVSRAGSTTCRSNPTA